MKFSNEVCPKCLGNDLDVYNSLIDYSPEVAVGYIFFVCLECGEEFEVIKEAEVVA